MYTDFFVLSDTFRKQLWLFCGAADDYRKSSLGDLRQGLRPPQVLGSQEHLIFIVYRTDTAYNTAYIRLWVFGSKSSSGSLTENSIVQGVKCVLYKVWSVYCKSVPCRFYNVYRLYCALCMCMIQGVLLKFYIKIKDKKKKTLISNLI